VLAPLANAALPPTAESMRRIKTIMDSKEVYDTLGGAKWIQSITQDNDDYVIKTEKCSLKVSLQSTPLSEQQPHMVGPPLLTVKVGKMECKIQ
jgi:hypothetical protein